MARALLVIVLVAAGAVALVFGLNLRTQLIAMFDPGLSGLLTAIVVACSSEHQAQLQQYRLLATCLLWGGPAALLLGLVIGCTGQKPAAADGEEKAALRPGKGRKGGSARKAGGEGKRGGKARQRDDATAEA
jgi:hypothetical protein